MNQRILNRDELDLLIAHQIQQGIMRVYYDRVTQQPYIITAKEAQGWIDHVLDLVELNMTQAAAYLGWSGNVLITLEKEG